MTMIKKFFLLIVSLSLLIHCRNRQYTCKGVEANEYTGYGVLFYHQPISGTNYEIIIIPTCADSMDITGKIDNKLDKLMMVKGVHCTVNIQDSLFSEVVKKSQKIKLLTSQALAPEFKVIHACPVHVTLKNIENNTQSVTSGHSDVEQKVLQLEDNHRVTLSYILSNTLAIADMRPIKVWK